MLGFDVLEHLDDLDGGLDEMARLAKRAIAVTLPNLAHVFFRLQLLRHGRVGAKYDLTYGYGSDRHRWFTVLPQTDAFMTSFAAAHDMSLEITYLTGTGGPKLRALERSLRLVRAAPAWWTWTVLYLFERH